MNTTEKNVELQVQLWALAGPIIAVATLATLLFEGSGHTLYLSWTLLAGIIVSWKWKVRGLVGALSALALVVGYRYLETPIDERLWHLGMAVAIALTFIITALTFEEIESLVGGLQQESSSRLKSLLQLDEKLETVQSKLAEEKEQLAARVAEQEEKIASYERLVSFTREEILSTHAQQEKLLQELFDRRHEVARLKEEIEHGLKPDENALAIIDQKDQEIHLLWKELEAMKKARPVEAVSDPKEKKYQNLYSQLRDQFEDKSRLLDITRRELFQAKERALVVENEEKQRLLERSEMERGLERCLADLEEERDRLLHEVEELHELISLSHA